MILTKQQCKTIARAIRKDEPQVTLNRFWKALQDELALSEPKQNKITLTAKDIRRLRDTVINQMGYDPLFDEPSGSRTGVSKQTKHEKTFGESPFASHLLIATGNPSGIRLKSTQIPCPANVFIGIDENDLQLQDISQVILIENGDTFTRWHELALPDVNQNALFVYRGHGTNQTRVKNLLNLLSKTTEKIGFLDPDPEGIKLLDGFNLTSVIIPEFLISSPYPENFINDFCKSGTYNDQINELGRYYRPSSLVLKKVYDKLFDNEWAFTQEAIIANKITLTKIALIDV
ncbi:MAG: hypothetical protein OXE99_15185 [Cellvibrionales bacterium]|nr:hypothetical protein [Cellvibrionales bacterium]